MRKPVCMIVGDDEGVVRLTQRKCSTLGVYAKRVLELEQAKAMIRTTKLDLLVLDFEHSSGQMPALSAELRESNSNRTTVCIGLYANPLQRREVIASGVTFPLEKPFNQELLGRVFNAAMPIVIRNANRYLRHPAQAPISIMTSNGRQDSAQLINISEGGLAFYSSARLEIGKILKAEFLLPGGT